MDIICVTDRQLCGDFIFRLKKIVSAKPKYIILREKDMSEEAYTALAREVLDICRSGGVPLICNTFFAAAGEIGADGIHLPLWLAKKGGCDRFAHMGISVHSLSEAAEAEKLGADYITYGHIFPTDCKRGLAPRGTEALREVCSLVNIPVYAIGGITPQNAARTTEAGAAGICLMSSLMLAEEPGLLFDEFNKNRSMR